jgi:hypothetical protein
MDCFPLWFTKSHSIDLYLAVRDASPEAKLAGHQCSSRAVSTALCVSISCFAENQSKIRLAAWDKARPVVWLLG